MSSCYTDLPQPLSSNDDVSEWIPAPTLLCINHVQLFPRLRIFFCWSCRESEHHDTLCCLFLFGWKCGHTVFPGGRDLFNVNVTNSPMKPRRRVFDGRWLGAWSRPLVRCRDLSPFGGHGRPLGKQEQACSSRTQCWGKPARRRSLSNDAWSF